jgi:hypothetical protein
MEERVVWSRWSAIGRSSQLQVTDEEVDRSSIGTVSLTMQEQTKPKRLFRLQVNLLASLEDEP